MFSLPDFIEKKIVFISHLGSDPCDLKFGNSNIRLYRNGKFTDQISCYSVFIIFIIGNTTITSGLIKEAQKFGISIFLLNNSFRLYGSINSKAEGNYQIRRLQYQMTKEKSLELSKKVVKNKIVNQQALITKINGNQKDLREILQKIENTQNLKEILGEEGSFASQYFKIVFKNFNWNRRSPQTKEDIENLLLDIGYTFLFNFVDSILNLFGFDTYKGFYHQLFFERKSLSCDLMESLRPLIDKELIKAHNLKQIQENDFLFTDGKFTIKPEIKICNKYTKIFAKMLMSERQGIYKYLSSYYYHLLNPVKYPEFNFKLCL